MLQSLPHVLLIDDHPLFRQGLRMMLSSSNGVEAEFHEAGSVAEALSLPLLPELMLLDISMPGCDGVSGLARLRERWPNAVVVMLSGHDHGELMQEAMRCGASGFMSKALAPDVICAKVAQWLRRSLGDEPQATSGAAEWMGMSTHPEGVLPERQFEVLKLVAQGFSNKAIAKRLDVSENTVRNQVVAILKHFDAETRTQAVATAQRSGVLPSAMVK